MPLTRSKKREAGRWRSPSRTSTASTTALPPATSPLAGDAGNRTPLFAMMVEMMERYGSHPDVRFMFEEVQPKTWQKELHTTADRVYTAAKLDTKATSIRCAIRLFPLVSFVKPWSGKGVQPTKIQDGMCDATLIAEYIRRKFKLF